MQAAEQQVASLVQAPESPPFDLDEFLVRFKNDAALTEEMAAAAGTQMSDLLASLAPAVSQVANDLATQVGGSQQRLQAAIEALAAAARDYVEDHQLILDVDAYLAPIATAVKGMDDAGASIIVQALDKFVPGWDTAHTQVSELNGHLHTMSARRDGSAAANRSASTSGTSDDTSDTSADASGTPNATKSSASSDSSSDDSSSDSSSDDSSSDSSSDEIKAHEDEVSANEKLIISGAFVACTVSLQVVAELCDWVAGHILNGFGLSYELEEGVEASAGAGSGDYEEVGSIGVTFISIVSCVASAIGTLLSTLLTFALLFAGANMGDLLTNGQGLVQDALDSDS